MVDIPDGLPGTDATGEVQALRDMNALLKSRLDMMDKEVETKNTQIQQLHVLLQSAIGGQAALPSPQSTQRLPRWQFWRRR